jgi:hypothetical protein
MMMECFSVVVRVDDIDATTEVARRHGASIDFQQDRGGNGSNSWKFSWRRSSACH